MGFTIRFIILFFGMLVHAAPILLFLVAVIALCARVVGQREHWKKFDETDEMMQRNLR